MRKVTLTLRGVGQRLEGETNGEGMIEIHGIDYKADSLPVDIPINGTVYGTLLNYQGEYEKLEPLMDKAPYKEPPIAPVLYIKPRNTYISHRSPIPLPADKGALQIGAAFGAVIGRTASKVKEEEALQFVAGYTIVNDVSIPHENIHRPAVKEKSRDGFCPIGPWVVSRDSIQNPNNLSISVSINGEIKQESSTKDLIRPLEKLITDVTDFMTLHKGDVLLVGVPDNPPLAKENDLVEIKIEKIGVLENRVINERKIMRGYSI